MTQDELREIATKALELAADRKDACEKEDVLRVGPAVVAWNNHAVKYHSTLAQAVLDQSAELETVNKRLQEFMRQSEISDTQYQELQGKSEDQSAEIERLRAALATVVMSGLNSARIREDQTNGDVIIGCIAWNEVNNALANQPKQQTPRGEERRKGNKVYAAFWRLKSDPDFSGDNERTNPDPRKGEKK